MRRILLWPVAPQRRGRLLLLGMIVIVGWVLTSPFRGMLMGYMDHLRGRPAVCVGGPPWPWWREEQALLRERYGVEVVGLPDAITPLMFPAISYWNGYDGVSRAWLQEKYRKDVVRECYQDAKAQWRAEHPEEYRKLFGDAP